jgi:UDP-galactopyranose mutase
MKYDFLIVGSGLFGSVFAYHAKMAGLKCLIIEQRDHVGGNCWSEYINGINCHKYGPHIFHTSNKKIWDFVNSLVEFYPYIRRIKANYRDKLYSFPINLTTFQQLWGITNPEEAKRKIESVKTPILKDNFESWIKSQIGEELYKIFYDGYTTKHWGKSPSELPAFIAKRIPIRYNFDDNYFSDMYQGLPAGGYQELFKKLLEGIDVKCNTDYFTDKLWWDNIADRILFTGKIDKYYGYCFGDLEYRGLIFKYRTYHIEDFQGSECINYTDIDVPYTRSVEYKHFDKNCKTDDTIVVYEYPMAANRIDIPYYPINDQKNSERYSKYRDLSKHERKVIFGGRIGSYAYYDMDKTIENAIELINNYIH